MIDKTDIKHHIQKYILSILMYQKIARFRDMRPPKTDTNLYSYHLNQLLKMGLVKKSENGYTLDTQGLIYVDRLSGEKQSVDQQPKVVTMFVIQNSEGDLLLMRRNKQPFIDKWALPHGKVHTSDSSSMMAARREAYEKLKVLDGALKHAGDCYIRVNYGDTPLTTTLAHVYTYNNDDIEITDQLQWIQPYKLHTLDLAPAVEELVARTFFRDPFYFEEYAVEW